MTAREFVKILLAKECMTIKELAKLASENSDKKYTLDGLSHKMRSGTLRYEDVELFAKLLGYEIELKKIEKIPVEQTWYNCTIYVDNLKILLEYID